MFYLVFGSSELNSDFAGPFLPCFWAAIGPKDNRDLKIELLTILADGCKKHPAYRALRPATGRCEPCVRMWQARLKLRELEQ